MKRNIYKTLLLWKNKTNKKSILLTLNPHYEILIHKAGLKQYQKQYKTNLGVKISQEEFKKEYVNNLCFFTLKQKQVFIKLAFRNN